METLSSNSDQQENQPAASSIDLHALAREAQEILNSMLPLLSFEAQLTVFIESNFIRIRLECQDAGRLIGRRGTTVNEIQFLLNRILQRRHKSVPRIYLDVKRNVSDQVDLELMKKVQDTVNQVRRWGESVEFGPLNTVDCRAIQEILAKDQELELIVLDSKGEAPEMQKIRIQLKQKA